MHKYMYTVQWGELTFDPKFVCWLHDAWHLCVICTNKASPYTEWKILCIMRKCCFDCEVVLLHQRNVVIIFHFQHKLQWHFLDIFRNGWFLGLFCSVWFSHPLQLFAYHEIFQSSPFAQWIHIHLFSYEFKALKRITQSMKIEAQQCIQWRRRGICICSSILH